MRKIRVKSILKAPRRHSESTPLPLPASLPSEKMTDKPHFVFRDGMTADNNYVQWIADIKSRYRNSQIKAAIRVNTALLEFY